MPLAQGRPRRLISLVLATMLAFAGITIVLPMSASAVPLLDKAGCDIRGRVWNGACTKTCQVGTGTITWGANYDYCSGTVSRLSQTQCSALGRKWLLDGCARRADQRSTANAPQCAVSGATYYVDDPYDRCGSPPPRPTTPSCTISGVPATAIAQNSPIIDISVTITMSPQVMVDWSYMTLTNDSAEYASRLLGYTRTATTLTKREELGFMVVWNRSGTTTVRFVNKMIKNGQVVGMCYSNPITVTNR